MCPTQNYLVNLKHGIYFVLLNQYQFLIEIKNANSRTDFLRNFFVSENFFPKPLDRSDYTCKMRILFERTRE